MATRKAPGYKTQEWHYWPVSQDVMWKSSSDTIDALSIKAPQVQAGQICSRLCFFLLIPFCWERLCEQEVGLIKLAVECTVFVWPSWIWTLFFRAFRKRSVLEKLGYVLMLFAPVLLQARHCFCLFPASAPPALALLLSSIYMLRCSQCITDGVSDKGC